MFNNNIRCIEITMGLGLVIMIEPFNNNIRCIEINQSSLKNQLVSRLITT